MKKYLILVKLLLLFASSAFAVNFGFPIQSSNKFITIPNAGATLTLTGNTTLTEPVYASYRYTANAGGYTLTLGETNANDGQWLCVYNVGANSFTLANDTGGTQLLAQYAEWCGVYQSDRWITRGLGGLSPAAFDTTANYTLTGTWLFNSPAKIGGSQTGTPYTVFSYTDPYIDFLANSTSTTGTKIPMNFYTNFNPTASSTGSMYSQAFTGEITTGNTQNTQDFTGLSVGANDNGSGTRTNDYGASIYANVSSAHGIFTGTATGLSTNMTIAGSTAIPKMEGQETFLAISNTGAGTNIFGNYTNVTVTGGFNLSQQAFASYNVFEHTGNGTWGSASQSSGGAFNFYRKGGTGTDAYALGAQNAVYLNSAGAITSAVGQEGDCAVTSTGTMGTCLSTYSFALVNAAGVISNYIGAYVDTPTISGGGAITNDDGVRILDQHPAGTTTSIGLHIMNQTSGGKAIVTGTGANEFGDTVQATTGYKIASVTATSGTYLKGDGTNFVKSTGSASGVGTPTACTNQAVTGLTLNADAAPTSTCTTLTGSFFGSSITARTVLGNATASAAAPTFSTTADALAYQTAEIPNKMFVTGNFTTAANTNLQAITGLTFTFPANTALNMNVSCHLLYSQATGVVADSFGFQDATVAPTNLAASGEAYTSATALTVGTLTASATTTATAVVTFTPSAITTIWNADLYFMIEQPSNASSSAFSVMVKTSTSGDAVTVYRGSYCQVL